MIKSDQGSIDNIDSLAQNNILTLIGKQSKEEIIMALINFLKRKISSDSWSLKIQDQIERVIRILISCSEEQYSSIVADKDLLNILLEELLEVKRQSLDNGDASSNSE